LEPRQSPIREFDQAREQSKRGDSFDSLSRWSVTRRVESIAFPWQSPAHADLRNGFGRISRARPAAA